MSLGDKYTSATYRKGRNLNGHCAVNLAFCSLGILDFVGCGYVSLSGRAGRLRATQTS